MPAIQNAQLLSLRAKPLHCLLLQMRDEGKILPYLPLKYHFTVALARKYSQ